MAENDSLTGKDLAIEQKRLFEENVQEAIETLNERNERTTVSIEGIKLTRLPEKSVFSLKIGDNEIELGEVDKDGNFKYNEKNIETINNYFKEQGTSLKELGLPDFKGFVELEKQKQAEEKEHNNNGEEIDDPEQDDNKPKLKEKEDKEAKDEKKEKIAKQYGVNSSQVIHIAKNKKITKENFGQIAKWSKDYDDIFILPGEDEYSRKFIGVKESRQEEIVDAEKQIAGKNPNVVIKRVGEREITEIRPIAMYELDDRSAIAVVRDQYGRPEALYCRQEGGDKKTFWGSVIPEASGKNVYQQGPEVREMNDYRYNSNNDLSKKADALSRQSDLEDRGLPSKEKGVQVEEIEGTPKQNREINVEDIKKYLMSRDGIVEEMQVPPNYYDCKAKEILDMMEEDKEMRFEDAVEIADNREVRKGEREGELEEEYIRGNKHTI